MEMNETLTALLKQYREGQRDMPTYAELVVYATQMDVMESQLNNAQGVIINGFGKTVPSNYEGHPNCPAEYSKWFKERLTAARGEVTTAWRE
jgi:hypothetical protein